MKLKSRFKGKLRERRNLYLLFKSEYFNIGL